MKSVDQTRLPSLDLLDHIPVSKVKLDGDLTQSLQPSEFAGLLEGFETGGVAGLERVDFGGDGEGFRV